MTNTDRGRGADAGVTFVTLFLKTFLSEIHDNNHRVFNYFARVLYYFL